MTREIAFRCNLCKNHIALKEVYGLVFVTAGKIRITSDPYSVDVHLCNNCYNELKAYYSGLEK